MHALYDLFISGPVCCGEHCARNLFPHACAELEIQFQQVFTRADYSNSIFLLLLIVAAFPCIFKYPLETLMHALTSSVTAWKELLSITPPVHTFSGLLTPVFIIVAAIFCSGVAIIHSKKKTTSKNLTLPHYY